MREFTEHRTTHYFVDDACSLIRGVVRKGSTVEYDDAVEAMKLHLRWTDGKPYRLLIDLTAVGSIPRQARAYFADASHRDVVLAVALVVGSQLSRAIGNFMLGLNKPAMPIRLFSDEEQAIAWLKTF